MNSVPQIFDTKLRRRRRERAVREFDAFSFLATAARDEIGERLDAVNRPFGRAVWHGAVEQPAAGSVRWVRSDSAFGFVPNGGLVFEEERLPFGAQTLELFASAMALHAANDLPGALAQIRRCLKPEGLFIGAMLGGRTLHELRLALSEAEIEIDGGLSPRVAPFVDVRDAGALLQRAGFAQPVADVDTIVVRYETPLRLFGDLRGMAETNVLGERRRTFLKRSVLTRAGEIYEKKFAGPDGRVPATFDIVYLTGWAPGP
ncbi:MAG: methyltransferase domain-containing protein [Alphaproteobacteria bacterium]|nr:methyltransferase domain-containing protein [Alphaproteobacteria bacterium]